MRKALILGLLGMFVASNAAIACPWGAKTASSDKQQTVMTDKVKPASGG